MTLLSNRFSRRGQQRRVIFLRLHRWSLPCTVPWRPNRSPGNNNTSSIKPNKGTLPPRHPSLSSHIGTRPHNGICHSSISTLIPLACGMDSDQFSTDLSQFPLTSITTSELQYLFFFFFFVVILLLPLFVERELLANISENSSLLDFQIIDLKPGFLLVWA